MHAPKRGVSVKDVLGNTEVKRRVVPAAGDTGDLKRRLEAREEEAAHKRGKPLPRSEPEPDKALEWLRAHNPDTLVKPESSAERFAMDIFLFFFFLRFADSLQRREQFGGVGFR